MKAAARAIQIAARNLRVALAAIESDCDCEDAIGLALESVSTIERATDELREEKEVRDAPHAK